MRPFQGTLEEASISGVSFLDLSMFKDLTHESSVVSFAPLLKSTFLLSTIGPSSAHPCGAHEAWMRSYIFTCRKHSTNIAWFESFKQEVLKRLLDAGIDHAIVCSIDRTTQCTYKIGLPSVNPCSFDRDSAWIRFPYHPLWSRAVNSALRTLSEHNTDFIRTTLQRAQIKAAWQLTMPALGAVVQKL